MSKHTNKYYQLIKILRNQKQITTMNKTLRDQLQKNKIEKSKTLPNEEFIARIIDQDNSIELDEEDNKKTKAQSKLILHQENHCQLWEEFKKKSLVLNQAKKLLPIQIKLNQNKDQAVIQHILEEIDHKRAVNEGKIRELSGILNSHWKIINDNKKEVDIHRLKINQCQAELAKLKADFDNEEKKTRQRSNRFKEEKSKDIMIKNIDRDDDHMRNAMMSKIKLNQELDFSFQLQRRKAFNQAKSAINEKKKTAQEKCDRIQTIYESNLKKGQELDKQKEVVIEDNKVLEKESVCFLKCLIKNFPFHSKGVKWMIGRLTDLKETLSKNDFPDQLVNQDKEFLQQLFRENKSIQRTRFNRTCMNTVGNKTGLDNSIEPSRIKMISMKTEPDAPRLDEFQLFRDKVSSPKRKLFKKNTVYFDVDNTQENWFREPQKEEETSKFYIKSNSLKKIYEHAGRVISEKIKKKTWNYESCKLMSASEIPDESIDSSGREKIKEKLKLQFMNVRQNLRRNQLSTFLFGER